MGTITGNSASALASPAAADASSVSRAAPQHPQADLPEEPLIIIQPSKTWAAINFRDILEYQGLLYFLTWRDVKVRYKQTALGRGMGRSCSRCLTTAVFTVFLGLSGAGAVGRSSRTRFFAFAGLLPWTFFAGAVASSSNSLVGNAHLITKVYFPRSIIPVSAVAARLPDFAIAFVVLIGMLFYYGAARGGGAS